jgi:RNA polymerase sigma factor (sigma-70 family)
MRPPLHRLCPVDLADPATPMRRTSTGVPRVYLGPGDGRDRMNDRDTAFAEYLAARSEAMRGTAYLLCGDWHRAEERRGWWRRERVTDSTVEQPVTPDPPENRLVMLQALAAVPPRQRAVLVLRYWEDLSVEDTAALLQCSTGTVKSQAARGLETLRNLLMAPMRSGD